MMTSKGWRMINRIGALGQRRRITGSLDMFNGFLSTQSLTRVEPNLGCHLLPVTPSGGGKLTGTHGRQLTRIFHSGALKIFLSVQQESLFIHRLQFRMSIKRLFEQGRARARKRNDEYRAFFGRRRLRLIPGRHIGWARRVPTRHLSDPHRQGPPAARSDRSARSVSDAQPTIASKAASCCPSASNTFASGKRISCCASMGTLPCSSSR